MGEAPTAASVAELRARLEADGTDAEAVRFRSEPLDDALHRFLQARKNDIAAAADQIRQAVAWRRDFAAACVRDGKAACLGAEVEEVAQFYAGAYAGHCKEGRPIWYEQTGQVDVHALHCLSSDEKFIRYHVCLMEELQDKYAENSASFGKTINKTLSILDLQGVTMAKLSSETLEFVKKIAKVDSANYPETMGKMLIINAPGIFKFAWGLVQAFLDPRTVSKIEILSGPEVWKPRLAQLVDADQLPTELGGTGPPCLPTTNAFHKVTIASGAAHKIEVAVAANDTVRFKFFTYAAGDISFKLVLVRPDGSELPLVPHAAYSADKCSNGHCVAGEVQCPEQGTVRAEWDHPGWWSREIACRAYKVELAAPAPAE